MGPRDSVHAGGQSELLAIVGERVGPPETDRLMANTRPGPESRRARTAALRSGYPAAIGVRRRATRRRQVLALAVTAGVPMALVLGFGERGSLAARNLILPGAGLYGSSLAVGAGLTALLVAATVLWWCWGADWVVLAVVVASVIASLVLAPPRPDLAAGPLAIVEASHEFPLLMALLGLWQAWRSLPLVARLLRLAPFARLTRSARGDLAGLADLARLGPVDRCRAVSVLALAGPVPAEVAAAIARPEVVRRAQRVALVARARLGSAALGRDQAALRTALLATGDRADIEALRAEAARQVAGVPASEPGWVRLLDGTLAAAVLGDTSPPTHWVAMLDGEFALRRGHRPARYWTPLGVPLGRAEGWEHALAAAIAHTSGWIGADDWPALRSRVLGAAARGASRPADERMIAAGRLWLTVIDEPNTARILARPTVRRDPLACAIDQLAQAGLPGLAEPRGAQT